MPHHIVKVGDRFKLGAWEWEVTSLGNKDTFCAVRHMSDGITTASCLFLNIEADSLDWLTPSPTITEEKFMPHKKVGLAMEDIKPGTVVQVRKNQCFIARELKPKEISEEACEELEKWIDENHRVESCGWMISRRDLEFKIRSMVEPKK